MFFRSTLPHLRILFSYYLMPVYFFALGISPNLNESRLLGSLLIIHLLLYPASNGYNSYFDKDEKSIGGLKNPPPVHRQLYYTVLLLDVVAVVLGFLYVNSTFATMLFVYGLASKAYSHPKVRLKKYAVVGWLTVVFFQGFFAFMMCYIGINAFEWGNLFRDRVLIAASLTSAMLIATYPMTQIYQHEEDSKRGDRTISIVLGIRGTFYFAMIFFMLAAGGFAYFFQRFYDTDYTRVFFLALLPVISFFIYWFVQILRDESSANHANTMWLNFISATCLNGFFIYFFLNTSHVLQY